MESCCPPPPPLLAISRLTLLPGCSGVVSGKRWVSSGASGPDKHAAASAGVLSPSAPPGSLRTAPGSARAALVPAPVSSAQFGSPDLLLHLRGLQWAHGLV